MPSLAAVWRWLQGYPSGPGIVYSEDMHDVNEKLAELKERRWQGNLQHVRMDNVPDLFVEYAGVAKAKPGPEEEPYTLWERAGLVPVHASRVRERQYYYPVTDFGMYDYDDISPEEKELTARWMARVMEFNGAVPAGILCATGCVVLPLHTRFRMPLLVAAGALGVAVEVTRSYMAASKQRQDLDDFILAKEIWYIKNVETYQLGIPRIPRGREAEYHAFIDPSGASTQTLPQELVDALHI